MFFFYLSYPALPPLPISQDDVKPIKQTSCISKFNIFERIRRVPPTKWGIILEGNTARMKTGNLFRKTESVYFYLINVNLPSHLIERNVELVNLHTGHIFIRYDIKI